MLMTPQFTFVNKYNSIKDFCGCRTRFWSEGCVFLLLRCSYSREWVYKWRRKLGETLTAEGKGWQECRAEREGGEKKRGRMDRNIVCVCCGPIHNLFSRTHNSISIIICLHYSFPTWSITSISNFRSLNNLNTKRNVW